MEIIKPSILPGFMELLPEDQIVFNRVKDIIKKTFEDNSFKPIETPLIEKSEILLAKGGGETSKQVYMIDREEKDMALRFDLTVPLARFVSEHYHELNFPFRRYHIGKVYRGERNQKGRYKEFYQCDIDIIGDKNLNIHYDAEVPAIMYQAFKNINVNNIVINMNNRKLLNGFFNSLGLENYTDILRVIDKKHKVSTEDFKKLLEEVIIDDSLLEETLRFLSINGSNEEIIRELKSLNIDNPMFIQGIFEIEEVIKYMHMFGLDDDSLSINLNITRGLDYYTGSVFETFIRGYEYIGSVCSGGRYDDLATNYTKQTLPGVGMSIGLTRLFYVLNEENLLEVDARPYCQALIVPMETTLEYSMDILTTLRKEGIRSQIYFENAKFKKVFGFADKENIKYVVIAGEDEMANNQVSLKNMVSGKQETLSLTEVIEIIKN